MYYLVTSHNPAQLSSLKVWGRGTGGRGKEEGWYRQRSASGTLWLPPLSAPEPSSCEPLSPSCVPDSYVSLDETVGSSMEDTLGSSKVLGLSKEGQTCSSLVD